MRRELLNLSLLRKLRYFVKINLVKTMNKASYLEIFLFSILSIIFLQSCKLDSQQAIQNLNLSENSTVISNQEIIVQNQVQNIDSDWEELTEEQGFVIDIRYASENNFMKKKIYDCGRCLMRKEAARALVLLNEELIKKYNFRLKIFDCFRPQDFQQRLWDIMPDINYVAHPSKGSMHNRGVAVDLTIVDSLNRELDMGTEFDFFGKEAHFDFTNLPNEVLANRKLLRAKMEQYGFAGIRTEWWHFSHTAKTYPLSNYRWPCDNK
jgi:zinc D-Ala-D-Ala dipeptidase